MESIKSLLNFSSSDGTVITFFDGKVTLSQLIMGIIIIAVILFVLKVIKGIMKTVIIFIAICVGLVHYGLASPTQIKDVTTQIANNGIKTYQTFANASENIKIQGKDIKLKIGDNWVSIADVSSFIKTEDGVATVVVDGENVLVDDSNIISLLETFK
jgi:hypothetical protein